MDKIYTAEEVGKVYPLFAIVLKNRYPNGVAIKELKPVDKWMVDVFKKFDTKE